MVFESSGLRLEGTLTLGHEPRRSACVVMIAGSGLVDRNENHKRFPVNVLGELAGHLEAHGFDSLRFDKRGVGASAGEFWTAGLSDNAADATAAVGFVRAQEATRGDRVFLLGHSEGAYLATMVAAHVPGLAGVVLLAGGARPGEEELRWQAEQVGKSMKGLQGFLIKLFRIDVVKAQAKQLGRVKNSNKDSYRAQLVAKVNAKWLREFMAYDPGQDLPQIKAPILAITGSKDIQVDPGNLDKMAGLVTAPFEPRVLPDVTHLLRADPGPAGLAAYKEQLKRPVASQVIEVVLEWLDRQAGPATV